ncbi:MAG: type II secretion system protein GspE [Candidatus Omnitrophica bacterium]|nr:type II secretion system protein GspE [Candidatus Omnitrophota bacterium]
MNSRIEKKAYQLLLNAGILPAEDLERVFLDSEASKEPKDTFSRLLVKRGLVREEDLLKVYAAKLGIPFVRLRDIEVEKSVFDKVPVKFAWYYLFFPFSLKGSKLSIAVSRLVDVNFLDEIRFGLGLDIESVLAPEQEIEEMLRKNYGLGADTVDKILAQNSASPEDEISSVSLASEVEDLEKLAETASVIQLVNQIILDACRKGASDIHFEPYRGKVRVRYRIDGVLKESPVPAEMRSFFSAMLSRIKIMANLNIIEKRLPQDGKARVKAGDQNLDLRVSSIPTPHGESLVIRILPGKMIRSLADLGFSSAQLDTFRGLLARPYGIIFVTGPTGSGKSTTLYAGLSELNTGEKKVITIEDPVEYELEGTTQIQVAPDVGLTFAAGLRSVLRHDPDIMMVGEVRDLETADIAIRVALTGHLILSTLHTNDAASGVNRLLDIGVEPYLVASSVNAFIAQRLVRLICPKCKKEDASVSPSVLETMRRELGIPAGESIKVFRGQGCDACGRSGYQGRVAIYEIMPVSPAIGRAIFERVQAEEIKRMACREGMETLRREGWKKVLQGVTTPEEVIEAAPADHDALTMNPDPAVSKPSFDLGAAPEDPTRTVSDSAVPMSSESSPARDDDFDEDESFFSNRRSYVRRKARLKFRFREIDLERDDFTADDVPAAQYTGGVTENVSASGLSFFSKKEMAPGMTLDIRLTLPDGTDLSCLSRVVRATKLLASESGPAAVNYQTGITFLAINSTDRAKLEKFCRESGAS